MRRAGVLTCVTQGGDDLVHQGLQDLSCRPWRVGHNGFPDVHSCLAHSVANICPSHEQQSQYLDQASIVLSVWDT